MTDGVAALSCSLFIDDAFYDIVHCEQVVSKEYGKVYASGEKFRLALKFKADPMDCWNFI